MAAPLKFTAGQIAAIAYNDPSLTKGQLQTLADTGAITQGADLKFISPYWETWQVTASSPLLIWNGAIKMGNIRPSSANPSPWTASFDAGLTIAGLKNPPYQFSLADLSPGSITALPATLGLANTILASGDQWPATIKYWSDRSHGGLFSRLDKLTINNPGFVPALIMTFVGGKLLSKLSSFGTTSAATYSGGYNADVVTQFMQDSYVPTPSFPAPLYDIAHVLGSQTYDYLGRLAMGAAGTVLPTLASQAISKVLAPQPPTRIVAPPAALAPIQQGLRAPQGLTDYIPYAMLAISVISLMRG